MEPASLLSPQRQPLGHQGINNTLALCLACLTSGLAQAIGPSFSHVWPSCETARPIRQTTSDLSGLPLQAAPGLHLAGQHTPRDQAEETYCCRLCWSPQRHCLLLRCCPDYAVPCPAVLRLAATLSITVASFLPDVRQLHKHNSSESILTAVLHRSGADAHMSPH